MKLDPKWRWSIIFIDKNDDIIYYLRDFFLNIFWSHLRQDDIISTGLIYEWAEMHSVKSSYNIIHVDFIMQLQRTAQAI